jgi:outer membrane protein TolC
LERIEINYLVLLGFLAVSAGISAGCTQSAITPEATELGMPAGWVRGGEAGTVDLNWLESFDDPQLTSLVSEAVTNNYLLEQERARLYQAEQTVIIVRADRFPDLDVSIDASRRGFTDASDQRATSESYGAEIGARWEVCHGGEAVTRSSQAPSRQRDRES